MFQGVKVFSATKAGEREKLGDKVNEWLIKNPDIEIVDTVMMQSSDKEFHCLTLTIFYNKKSNSPS